MLPIVKAIVLKSFWILWGCRMFYVLALLREFLASPLEWESWLPRKPIGKTSDQFFNVSCLHCHQQTFMWTCYLLYINVISALKNSNNSLTKWSDFSNRELWVICRRSQFTLVSFLCNFCQIIYVLKAVYQGYCYRYMNPSFPHTLDMQAAAHLFVQSHCSLSHFLLSTDGISSLAGNILCRRCCQRRFII